MYSTMTDIELLEAIRKNDILAFHELYARYSEMIYKNILARINNTFDADDIFQMFFIQIWEKRQNLEIPTSVKAYLLIWLRNLILNTIKKEQIRNVYEENSFQGDYDNKTWQEIISRDLNTNICHIAEQLPPRMRMVYELRYVEDLSIKEVASELCVSEQTVKNQLGSILKRFKNHIKSNLFSFFL